MKTVYCTGLTFWLDVQEVVPSVSPVIRHLSPLRWQGLLKLQAGVLEWVGTKLSKTMGLQDQGCDVQFLNESFI